MSVRINSNVEAISSTLNYQLAVTQEGFNKRQMKRFLDTSYEVVSTSFGKYLDARARANPKALHHVYEWNMVGERRLWALTKAGQTYDGFRIGYRFMQSRKKAPINKVLATPNPVTGAVVTKTYVFRNKAEVMESGRSVTMRPRGKNRIAYPSDRTLSGIAFTRGPLVVRNPGGPQTTFAFQKALAGYFASGLATKELKASGAMDGPTRRIKVAAEHIPATIRSLRFNGNMSVAALKSEAAAAIARAG